MKTIPFSGHSGVRNDISQERFKQDDLSAGVNVDVDKTGKVWRRDGTTNVLAGVMHSLYNNGDTTLVVDGTNLTQLDVAFGKRVLAIASGARVAYETTNRQVFWSDELVSGVVKDGVNRRWGVAVPPVPSVSIGVGDFAEGSYLVTTTYVRNDDHESGAPRSTEIPLAANQGFTLGLTPSLDPNVLYQRIYLSDINGKVCFLAGEVLNPTLSVTLTALPQLGAAVRTQFMGPPPAGQVVGYFKGRMYIAKGPYLWYSLPYEFELFDLRNGYMGFDTNVTTFAAVEDGIYVGTGNSVSWLSGNDPTKFDRKVVAPFGAVLGTEKLVPAHMMGDLEEQGDAQVFMTSRGLCAGFDGGVFKNLTGARYFPVSASRGASLLKVRDGSPLLTTSLFN